MKSTRTKDSGISLDDPEQTKRADLIRRHDAVQAERKRQSRVYKQQEDSGISLNNPEQKRRADMIRRHDAVKAERKCRTREELTAEKAIQRKRVLCTLAKRAFDAYKQWNGNMNFLLIKDLKDLISFIDPDFKQTQQRKLMIQHLEGLKPFDKYLR